MRLYGSVQVTFWENPVTQKLSDQAKLMAIYLMTGPHSNMIGCLRLPDGYITEDLLWSAETVRYSFQQLSEINFLIRDDFNHWLIIHDFLKWNPIQNPRQGIGVQKIFNSVPVSSKVFKPLIKSLLTHGKYLSEEFINQLKAIANPCETRALNCHTDKEQDQNNNKDKLYMPDITESQISNNGSDENNQMIPIRDQSSYRKMAVEVLDFLNMKAARAYRPVDANLKLIEARLKSGVTVLDCRQVIARKVREWKGDLKMEKYLRPETLFNSTKFEQYMGELILPENEFRHESN